MTVDLTTCYLGITLRNPLVVAACPLTSESHLLERLEAAGAAAAVMTSLFEEQLRTETAVNTSHVVDQQGPYIPALDNYNTGVDTYLRRLEVAKRAVSMPIFGSLNGTQQGGWVRFARLIQDAGADALELNIYFVPTDAELTSVQVENRYLELVAAVRERISIPLAVKIGPYFSALPHFAARLAAAGTDGLILFNRYLQPDIDLETREVRPQLLLSTREEVKLSLRWIALLRRQLSVSLAAASGIHSANEVLKCLLAGADATMMASTLIRHGPEHLASVLQEMMHWMNRHAYSSIKDLQGLVSTRNPQAASSLERANYTDSITSFRRLEQP